MPNQVALLLAVLLCAPLQPSERPESLPSPAEFPPQDRAIWGLASQGIAATLAARRLVAAPDSPETVRLLAVARNLDGMLGALRRIVDTQPRRIADAFEAIGGAAWQFRGDDEQARRNAETLQQIVANARKRLSDLPREEAARAERVFITPTASVT